MRSTLAAAALFGALAAGTGTALAQATQGSTTTPALRTDGSPTADGPVPGSNSFTEGQARSRMEDAGFSDVTDLQKDDQGIWRGRAVRGGSSTGVALDFQGNVFGGGAIAGSAAGSAPAVPPHDGAPGNPPGAAAGRAVDRTLGSGANPGGGRPDGAPGNPPSTAAGRAVDRAQGQPPQPDGTPGNPAGTAAGRAVDRALGSNTTSANPGTGNAPSR